MELFRALNLLTNASDAMPEGGTINLRVAATRRDEAPPSPLSLPIPAKAFAQRTSDEFGIRFSPRSLRAKAPAWDWPSVACIVEEHGGTIGIESEAGHGTKVRIVLPATNT